MDEAERMETLSWMSGFLVNSGGFTDLKIPVILAGGDAGLYYVNAEKMCQDGGEYKEYKDNSEMLIYHSVGMALQNPNFSKVIDFIAKEVEFLLPDGWVKEDIVISGGQTRDWIFSGPVAENLGAPHVSLPKLEKPGQEYSVQVVLPDGYVDDSFELDGKYAVHIVDLITEGSSVYDVVDGEEMGWVPMLRENGVYVNDLIAVVDRLQGGKENLLEQGVKVHSLIPIDEVFLRKYSDSPERAVDYLSDPKEWTRKYLVENGALDFVGVFDPNGGKLKRARSFIERYGDVLGDAGHLHSLEKEVIKNYGKSISDILEVTV